MFHSPNPDGVYFFNFGNGTSSRLQFSEEARAAGFKAICLATMPDEQRIAVGTSHGQVFTSSFKEDDTAPEIVHQGRFPVTSVCFSPSGNQVAVGDAGAQVAVYDLQKKNVVFQTEQLNYVVAAKVNDSGIFILYYDRMEIATEAGQPNENIPLTDGFAAIDFAQLDNIAVILSSRLPTESEKDDARFIQVVDLSAKRVVLTVAVPDALPISHSGKPFVETLRSFDRIKLYVDRGDFSVVMGSPEGLIKYPFLAFGSGKTFVLPKSAAKRDRDITVMRIGSKVPELSCEAFTIPSNRAAVICSYSDNQSHPNITGELRIWDLHTEEYSDSQSFGSSVSSLESTSDGTIIVGTEHGKVSSWQFERKWQLLASVTHSVAVQTVACAERQQLACSVSRDGQLMAWSLYDGMPILRTFVDVEPVRVGFLKEGRQLCLVDRSGEVHVWEIEGYEKLLQNEHAIKKKASKEYSLTLVQKCIDGANHLSHVQELYNCGELNTAKELINTLPEMPNVQAIKKYWLEKLNKNSS
jgi:WD40 repeat protein